VFPNLFIIGAMKAGTSSLHEYLHQHPEIYMSRFKEPQYFAPHTTREGVAWGQGNPYPEPGIDWYLRLFKDAGDVKYAGESSVSYSALPSKSGCAERLYDFNRDARIIYLMRDPIERTISHYWHRVASGYEGRDMLTAIRQTQGFLDYSNYAMQLRPYLEMFGRAQVFALTTEELRDAPQQTLRRVFAWLGVDTEVSIETDIKHNVGPRKLRQTRRGAIFIYRALRHRHGQSVVRRVPRAALHLLEKIVYREVTRDEAGFGPTISYLVPIVEVQVQELSVLLHREFPEWTTVYQAINERASHSREPVSCAGRLRVATASEAAPNSRSCSIVDRTR
jgi:hypothetical protein